MPNKKKRFHKKKYGFGLVLSFGLLLGSVNAFSQGPPPPPGPPPSPGHILNSINPFKKHKNRKSVRKRSSSTINLPAPPDAPAPPPNPANLFKKNGIKLPPPPPGPPERDR